MSDISIVIPVYNQGNYLQKTIDSVLNQTFKNWDCIIVNDGSTDNTEGIVKEYLDKDKRLKYIYQKNHGPSTARNNGIEHSTGRYIAFLDADDLWEPEMLEQTHDFLEKNQGISVVCTAWDFIDEAGKIASRKMCPFSCQDYSEGLMLRNLFPIHTLLLRREIFTSCGIFDTNLISMEDWDMWFRAVHNGFKFHPINRLLAHYRLHSKSASVNVKRMTDYTFTVIEKFFNEYLNSEMVWKKPYIEIFQYLLIAKENRKYLKNEEIKNYIEKANVIFLDTSYNYKYSQLFYNLAIILPGSDKFLENILKRTPTQMKFKMRANGLMKKSIYNFLRKEYMKALFGIISSCILWPPILIRYIRFIFSRVICF